MNYKITSSELTEFTETGKNGLEALKNLLKNKPSDFFCLVTEANDCHFFEDFDAKIGEDSDVRYRKNSELEIWRPASMA